MSVAGKRQCVSMSTTCNSTKHCSFSNGMVKTSIVLKDSRKVDTGAGQKVQHFRFAYIRNGQQRTCILDSGQLV